MSAAKAENISATSKKAPEEKIIGFQPELLKAPFSLRCGALLIDYILLIAVPVLSLLAGRMFGEDGRKLLESRMSGAGWMIAGLIAVSNLFIFPAISGQTIGKMLTGLRIVRTDGTNPSIANLLVRHLIGYPLIVLTGGLGFLISVVNSKGRALDDFISGTIVIRGKRRTNTVQTENVK